MFVLTPFDPGYPLCLGDLSSPPSCLYVEGALPELQRTVSIVGTRSSDDEALIFTRTLAGACARAGRVVVSGGARGVDRAAHEGALDAGGTTIAVLPLGLDQRYPREHHRLFSRIAESGCLLSEVDAGAAMRKGRFLARNRLIAAIGRVTIVVQAPARSGALSTAHHASQLGRPLFAVPASPWDPRGLGNLRLLEEGARICASAADVLSGSASVAADFLQPRGAEPRDPSNYGGLSPIDREVMQALAGRARHPDEVCARTGIAAVRVQRSILTLLVRGLIEERPGGRFKSCGARRESY